MCIRALIINFSILGKLKIDKKGEIVKLTEEIEKPSWAQSLFDNIDDIDKELIES